MPRITNKKTGVKQNVSDDGLKTIQENKLTAPLYTYENTPEPKEVTEQKKADETAKTAPAKGK